MTMAVNPDLQKERKAATFDSNQLTYVLDGGEGITKQRRAVVAKALADIKELNVPEYYFQSREEAYTDSMRRSAYYIKKFYSGAFPTNEEAVWYRSELFPNENPPLALQFAMFIPTLEGQTTPEQKAKWLPQAKNFKMLGTYAQTEIGHGTHVRGLETTATYDPNTEEFILNSPTLSSIKFWPGSLGKTTNHTIVMAKLYSKGVNHGVHPFLVQTRCMETHQPLKGITIGDIGPKFGYDTIDNGFLKMDNVRIPRENMLMKYARVERDGTFVKESKNAKMNYGVMVQVRALISFGVAAYGLAQACTIAIRYSCVRRQSELDPKGKEPQILDFQTQQHKLLPYLASAFAYWFSGWKVIVLHREIVQQMDQGNVDLLPELHALSSGLKAYTTLGANIGMEMCRLACGGHGYSHASGLPKIYVHATPACTYEGENTVLYLQTARYLAKNLMSAQKGMKLSGSVEYLSSQGSGRSTLCAQMRPECLVEAFKHRAKRLVVRAAQKMAQQLSSGKPQYEAWNNCSVYWVMAAEAHIAYYVVKTFAESVTNIKDVATRNVMSQVFQLYAAFCIIEKAGDFIVDGFMSSEQLEQVNERFLSLLSDIRPNAVALVDAFDFSDHKLGSVLGRYDGNVYENLYKWAKASPLNKDEVHSSYKQYLRPLMKETQAKL